MRSVLLSLARQQYLRSFFLRTGTTVKTRIGTLPFLFGIATTSEVLPCNTPCHSSLQKRESSYLDHRSNLIVGYTSWRDIPQLARETVYDICDKTKGIVGRRMESEGGSATMYITATNLAVYLLWKLAPTGFMVRHFANSLESMRRARVWTTITSNFSHMGLFHLASNMYLLNRFGFEVADILGAERFYIFYGAAGVASSLASLTFRRITKSNVLSLGASGAVVATLWLYACFFPDRRMSILGSEKTLTMQELVLAYTVIDAAGLLGSAGKIDFAAHLGGAVFGNSWFYVVREKLVQEHSIRKNNENRSIWRGLSGISDRHPGSQSNEK